MENSWERAARVAVVAIFLAVNCIIAMAMVIAPSDSGIMQLANQYKLANLTVGAVALVLAIWRKWFVFLFAFGMLQLVAFFWFASYLNSIPF